MTSEQVPAAANAGDEERLLSDEELSKRWGVALSTLRNWRQKGEGPVYQVLGARLVRYRLSDVVAFESKDRRTSTR